MGMGDVIEFTDDIINYIIDKYTCEPGVRKLKEILFEIIGEANLQYLEQDSDIEYPIQITEKDITDKYLKTRQKIRHQEIHRESQSGIINGLWANALGKGGIIPIEAQYFPSKVFFDLKLTGQQGDVMKESMNVAKTLSWSLLTKEQMIVLSDSFETTKLQGVHIHCPEGAVPKDGPSAGTAITTVLYSLFVDRKIKRDIAITGEINLQGYITAIGGLDLKILGGIQAGVKEFIYPEENDREFKEFMDKHQDSGEKSLEIAKIKFHAVSHIKEVLEMVFV